MDMEINAESVQVLSTTKGKRCVWFRGYQYREEVRAGARAGRLTWRCTDKQCNGRLWTSDLFLSPQERGAHSHLPDANKLKIVQLKATLKERAARESTPIPRIYREEATRLESASNGELSAPPYASLQANLYRHRHANYAAAAAAADTANVHIPEKLLATRAGERFLLRHENERGLLVFGTAKNLELMCDARDVWVDATFDVPPYHLLTLHALVDQKLLPLVYCLLSSKSTALYVHIIRTIRDCAAEVKRVWDPEVVMSDFDAGIIQAVRQELPRARHRGSYSLHTQALIHELQRLDLVSSYRDDRQAQNAVQSLMALGFLPPDRVEPAFDDIITRAPAVLLPLFVYYRSYWLETIGVRMFNVHGDVHPLSNVLESWHTRFNRAVGRHHPNIDQLLEFLISEQADTQDHIANFELGRSVSCTPAKTQRVDLQISDIQRLFSNGSSSEASFLKSIGQCLHSCIRISTRFRKEAANASASSVGPEMCANHEVLPPPSSPQTDVKVESDDSPTSSSDANNMSNAEELPQPLTSTLNYEEWKESF